MWFAGSTASTIRADQNRPSSSSGKTWANIAGSKLVSPTSFPSQPEYFISPVSGISLHKKQLNFYISVSLLFWFWHGYMLSKS